jgi:hypothetical protein
MRLGRILIGLVPCEPEALGLMALMELQAARFAARTGAAGEAIPLLEQDRSRWDFVLIGRGLKGLERAEVRGGRSALTRSNPARYSPSRPPCKHAAAPIATNARNLDNLNSTSRTSLKSTWQRLASAGRDRDQAAEIGRSVGRHHSALDAQRGRRRCCGHRL